MMFLSLIYYHIPAIISNFVTHVTLR